MSGWLVSPFKAAIILAMQPAMNSPDFPASGNINREAVRTMERRVSGRAWS
jgi:hypothetical protein